MKAAKDQPFHNKEKDHACCQQTSKHDAPYTWKSLQHAFSQQDSHNKQADTAQDPHHKKCGSGACCPDKNTVYDTNDGEYGTYRHHNLSFFHIVCLHPKYRTVISRFLSRQVQILLRPSNTTLFACPMGAYLPSYNPAAMQNHPAH